MKTNLINPCTTNFEDDVQMLNQLANIDHRAKVERTDDHTQGEAIRKAMKAVAELITAKADAQKQTIASQKEEV